MTYGTTIMFLVAALLSGIGIVLLLRLRRATIGERKTYAYRMMGVMLLAAGIVLAFSAAATWRWSIAA